MKKVFVVLPLVAALAACSTTSDRFDKRSDGERERQEKQAASAVSQAPKWMDKLPESKSAVFANGSAISRDYSMAQIKAKAIAYSKICMAAGGKVDQQTKVFMMDSEAAGTEMSETVIRSICPKIDITGTETLETKTVPEGGRFRSYVLVSLPFGDANAMLRRKDQQNTQNMVRRRQVEAFKELDANNEAEDSGKKAQE